MNDWPELDLRPAREPDPLILPGEYDAKAVQADVHASLGGRLKFFLTLEIIAGSFAETRLHFIATLPRNGRGIAPSSKYYRSWVAANGGRRPTRRDRMSPTIFKDKALLVRVRTVEKDHQGRPLRETHRYSVVDEILPWPSPAPDPSPFPTPTPAPAPPPAPSPSPPTPGIEGRCLADFQDSDGNLSGSSGRARVTPTRRSA